MAKNRVLLVFEIVLLLVFISSLVSCGGGRASSQATPAATASQRLGTGPLGLPLYCPLYLTHDQQGNIYATDSDALSRHNGHRARIVKLSPSGQLLAEWHVFNTFQRQSSFLGNVTGPFGLAVAASGTIYVADAGDNTIKKLSPTGTLLAIFGNTGSSTERLKNPVGIAVDAQDDLYVSDIRNHRLVKFSPQGTFLAAWSGAGAKAFSSAKMVAVDSKGNVYVADARNQRLVKLSPTGRMLAIWERPMDPGMDGITVDLQGNIYFVSEAGTGSIVKLSPSGAVLATWPATCIPPK